MSEVWKQWEGRVADHKYQLQQYLGSTDHSAVFRAAVREPEPRQVAVKFISADMVNADQQLAAWNNAAKLSHRNLLRVYGTGRCRMEDMDLLYVAMEYAEENLAQVLPQRALTVDEAREMLNSVVEVLVDLHGRNLAHGHIKPSNILAIGDLLKLSSDTIQSPGAVRAMRRVRSAYDAPEIPDGPYTPAADVWSLGVTLVEALTQQPALLPLNEQDEPIIPPELREPFLGIARHCLQRNPKMRWSIARIAEHLNPAAAAPKAAAAATASASANVGASAAAGPAATATKPSVSTPPPISPLNVPLSKEPAIPLARLQPATSASPPMPRPHMARPAVSRPPLRSVPRPPRKAIVLPNYVVPLLVGVVVLIAIIGMSKILRRQDGPAPNTVASSVSAGSTAVPAESSLKPSPPAKNTPDKQTTSVAEEKQGPTSALPLPETPAAAPAVLRSNETKPASAPKTSSVALGRGDVLDQILPKPSTSALATIQGTVRVGVRVHVDEAGNVSEALLDAPGPSKYFADLSLKAARGWVFSSPEADGRDVPSDWLLHFYFTQSGVHATANQTKP
jgi:serine/threonine protein kinase